MFFLKQISLIEGVIVELSITFWFELTLYNTLLGVTVKVLVEEFSLVFRLYGSISPCRQIPHLPVIP